MFMLTPFERKRDMFFDDFFDDFDKSFFGITRPTQLEARTFRTDIKDNGDSYLLEAELPGFDKNDINIDINDGYLVISAEKKAENEETDNDGKYIRKERYYGAYKRSFNLDGVDADAISAEFENGILSLNMPKLAPQSKASRRLEIK